MQFKKYLLLTAAIAFMLSCREEKPANFVRLKIIYQSGSADSIEFIQPAINYFYLEKGDLIYTEWSDDAIRTFSQRIIKSGVRDYYFPIKHHATPKEILTAPSRP